MYFLWQAASVRNAARCPSRIGMRHIRCLDVGWWKRAAAKLCADMETRFDRGLGIVGIAYARSHLTYLFLEIIMLARLTDWSINIAIPSGARHGKPNNPNSLKEISKRSSIATNQSVNAGRPECASSRASNPQLASTWTHISGRLAHSPPALISIESR